MQGLKSAQWMKNGALAAAAKAIGFQLCTFCFYAFIRKAGANQRMRLRCEQEDRLLFLVFFILFSVPMPRKDVHVLLLCCSFLYQNKDNMNMIYTHPQTLSYTTANTSSMYILEICTHYLPLHRICKQVKESDELRSL